MIQEARNEALAEAKTLLKERMLQAILESATEDQSQKKEAGLIGRYMVPATTFALRSFSLMAIGLYDKKC